MYVLWLQLVQKMGYGYIICGSCGFDWCVDHGSFRGLWLCTMGGVLTMGVNVGYYWWCWSFRYQVFGRGFGHGKRGCFSMGLVNREGGGFLLLWGGSWNGLGRFSPFFWVQSKVVSDAQNSHFCKVLEMIGRQLYP